MNEEMMMNNSVDEEIDLMHLFFSLLTHWRSLIAVIIVGVMLGIGAGGVKYVLDTKATNVPHGSTEEWAEELELTDDLISEMEEALYYRERYEELKAIIDNSSDNYSEDMTALQICRNTFLGIERSLTPELLEYYKENYLSLIVDMEEEIDSPVKNAVKFAVVFAFLACFAWGGYFLLIYLLDGTIKTAADASIAAGAPVIAYLPEHKKTHRLDHLLEKAIIANTGYAVDMNYLENALTGLASNDYLITTATETSQDAAKLSLAADKVASGSIALDPQQLNLAKSHGAVILTVKAGVTKLKDIKQQKLVANLHGINVLGVLLF